jgi:predicted XRE-type DNA-binding protein
MRLGAPRKTHSEAPEPSSGNVFADLGFRNAEVRLLKAKLATEIAQSIERKGCNQPQIAERTGLGPAEISRLLRGQLSGFSTNRLITILNGLEFYG